jgi:cell division ATPase FtsA
MTDVNDLIRNAVANAVATEMLNDDVTKAFIMTALNEKRHGPNQRGHETPQSTFLVETVRNAIQQATERSVKEVVFARLPELEVMVTEQLTKSLPQIASALVSPLTKSQDHGNDWRINFNVTFEAP